MGCEISEEKVLVWGDKKIRGSNVAVVDIEVLMHCEGTEYHLVDKPNWVRRRYVFTISWEWDESIVAAIGWNAGIVAQPLRSFAHILLICDQNP